MTGILTIVLAAVVVLLLAWTITLIRQNVRRTADREARMRELERMQAALNTSEARLLESNQIMAGILEHTHMMAVLLDAHFNFIWVNHAYAQTCQYAQDFFPGKNHFELYPHPENEAIFRRVVESGEPFFVEAKPFEFPDQPERGMTYWDWSLIPIKNTQGQVINLVFTLAEVTGRIRAEEAQRTSTAKLAAVIESMTDAVFISDSRGNFVDFNAACVTYHRFRDKAECYEKLAAYPDYIDVFFDDGTLAPLDRWAVPRALRGETVSGAEYILKRKDTGETWWGSYSFGPIRDRHGAIVGSVVVGREITDHKRMEAALRENESKLRSLFEIVPVGISILDAERATVSVNPALERILGIDQNGLLRGDHRQRRYLRADGTPMMASEFASTRALHERRTIENVETGIVMEDGRVIWTNVSAVPVAFPDWRVVIVTVDITARKQAEIALFNALASNEMLLREQTETLVHFNTAQHIARIGSWKWDMRRNMLWWSDETYRLFGVTPDTFTPSVEDNLQFAHPDDRDEYRMRFEHSIHTGEPLAVEMRLVPRNGGVKWCHIQGRVEYDPQGAPVTYIGTIMDVTERKLAQAQIQSSQALLQAVIDHSQYLIYAKDLEGRFILASQSLADFFGHPPKELIGKTSYDFLPQAIADQHRANDQEVVRRGSVIEMEETAPSGNGVLTFLTTKFPLRADDGRIYAVCGASVDITARKRYEEAIKQREALLNSAQRLTKLGGWEWNIVEQRMYWTEEVYRIHDLDPHTFMPGVPEHIQRSLECYLPADRPVIQAAFERCARQGDPYDLEFPFRTTIGRRLWIRTTAEAVRDDQGRIVRVVGNIMDITEHKTLQIERERLSQEIGRKNKELERVVYATSHDLRSPLLNIQGFGRRLEKSCAAIAAAVQEPECSPSTREKIQPILSESIPKALRFIRTSVDQMDGLIRGLLQLSRLGRVELEIAPLDMRRIVDETLASLSFRIQEIGAAVVIGELPPCRGDARQVTQVLVNLLDNALKYRDLARPLAITISGRQREETCEYCVVDNGIGIAPEHQERIWELFQRVDPDGRIAGEGLGLTMLRRILERHGGAIWVESTAGEGSRFCFTLPRAPEDPC